MAHKVNWDRANKILEAARARVNALHGEYVPGKGWQGDPEAYRVANQLDEIDFHSEYKEPGYGRLDRNDAIATGNWNPLSFKDDASDLARLPARVGALLERCGFTLEWSDEWYRCDECQGLVRTSADSYSWEPSYVLTDGALSCSECIAEDAEGYLASIEGEVSPALHNIDPEDHGYERLDHEFEAGLYGGQCDDPKRVAEALDRLGVSRFVFRVSRRGQFETRFEVFVHGSEFEEWSETAEADALLGKVLADPKLRGPDPVDNLKRQLGGVK